jgi:Arc-like DNA binding domain
MARSVGRPKTRWGATFHSFHLELPAAVMERVRDDARLSGRPINTELAWMIRDALVARHGPEWLDAFDVKTLAAQGHPSS